MKHAKYALIFKALADETRLKIIELINDEELCACKILESLDITQPTLSYHMKILCESEIVNSRREGAWIFYTLNKESLALLTVFLCRFNYAPPSKKITTRRKNKA